MNILLIDDDDIAAEAMSRAIRDSELVVFRARDGMAGLEALRDGAVSPPFVILLDLRMPRMGGFDFLDELRADDRLRGEIVFVLTTSADRRDIDEAYRRGVAGYVVKSPDSLERLVRLLEAYVQVIEMPS